MEEEVRKQAEYLYLQGLRLYAQSAASAGTEGLELVAETWQKAWEMYGKIGDKTKARELEKSMVDLYRKKYLELHLGKEQPAGVIGKFNDWFVFFKIGCFGFGGPMAVFALLEEQLVNEKKILTTKDFLEGAVLGDILPGPVTMDIVTYVGYKLKKWRGAAMSTVFFILPSFVLMLFLAAFYDKLSMSPKITEVFRCLGAAVTGLIVSVGFRLTRSEIKNHYEIYILLCAFVLSLTFKLDIVIIVILAGLAGVFLYSKDNKNDRMKEINE